MEPKFFFQVQVLYLTGSYLHVLTVGQIPSRAAKVRTTMYSTTYSAYISVPWKYLELRILSTDAKVKTTLHVSIIDSGGERVPKLNKRAGKEVFKRFKNVQYYYMQLNESQHQQTCETMVMKIASVGKKYTRLFYILTNLVCCSFHNNFYKSVCFMEMSLYSLS